MSCLRTWIVALAMYAVHWLCAAEHHWSPALAKATCSLLSSVVGAAAA